MRHCLGLPPADRLYCIHRCIYLRRGPCCLCIPSRISGLRVPLRPGCLYKQNCLDFTDQEVNYSIKLSIPSDANGTRDIQFQLVGSNLNSSVYTSSLVVVVPSAQRCGLVCKGNMVLDANKCICVCNITCPQVADLDNVSCLCKNSQPISNKPITPPAARDEPKYAVISPLVFVLIILALQLIWIIPLLVLLRIKRII